MGGDSPPSEGLEASEATKDMEVKEALGVTKGATLGATKVKEASGVTKEATSEGTKATKGTVGSTEGASSAGTTRMEAWTLPCGTKFERS